MIQVAIFHTVIKTLRLVRMDTDIHIGSVFGNDDWRTRIFLLIGHHKLVESVKIASIPALIQIPANNHRHSEQSGILISRNRTMERNQRIALCVQPTDSLLQFAGLTVHFLAIALIASIFLIIRWPQHHLIHVGPYYYRRMVIALLHHFLNHIQAVGQEFLRFSDSIHNRNFHRSQYTQLVAHIQYQRVLRIMRNTQEVSAHLFQQAYITDVNSVVQRITIALIALMTAGTYQFQRLSVQEKSLVSIKREPAQSEVFHYLIQHLTGSPFFKLRLDRVEGR